MHECILCGRNMKKSKTIFGNGCIKRVYALLNIKLPKRLKNKEQYLYKNVMKEVGINSLNSNKKELLVDRYLTYKYLDNLNYGDYSKIKDELNEDITKISKIENTADLITVEKITLNQSYNLYKKEQKFNEYIIKIKNDDKINIKDAIEAAPVNLIIKKNTNIIEKGAIIGMQYALWEIVIAGGKMAGYNSSSELLEYSLKDNPNNLLITEGEIIEEKKNDINFKSKIKSIVQKYGKNKEEFIVSDGEDSHIQFNDSDLYYSIHGASIIVQGNKNDGKWDLNITISDIYDYTKFKQIKDYYNDTNSVPKSMFSSCIYNLAYFSVKFNVINVYSLEIKFNIDNYEVN